MVSIFLIMLVALGLVAGTIGCGQPELEFGRTLMVAAGYHHTVGLKTDGTVVAVGGSSSGQCDVGGWTHIVQIAAGEDQTVGAKSDGTVVAGWVTEPAKWDLF
jgi:alpha-tubulin suppressor-like RCC1 family protein